MFCACLLVIRGLDGNHAIEMLFLCALFSLRRRIVLLVLRTPWRYRWQPGSRCAVGRLLESDELLVVELHLFGRHVLEVLLGHMLRIVYRLVRLPPEVALHRLRQALLSTACWRRRRLGSRAWRRGRGRSLGDLAVRLGLGGGLSLQFGVGGGGETLYHLVAKGISVDILPKLPTFPSLPVDVLPFRGANKPGDLLAWRAGNHAGGKVALVV